MSKKSPNSPIHTIVAFLFLAIITISSIVLAIQITGFNGLNTTQASVEKQETANFVIPQGSAIANQDGNTVTVGSQKMWIGTGASTSESLLGLYFTGANIPPNANIKSATLEVTAEGGWITTDFGIYGDTSGKGFFSTSDKLSTRSLTSTNATYKENVKWDANKAYTYDVTAPVKEAVGTNGKAALALIVKGGNAKYARKTIFGDPVTGKSPKLTVVYTTMVPATSMPSTKPSTQPSTAPSTAPTNAPTTAPSPTMDPNHPMPSGTPTTSTPGSFSTAMTAWSTTGKSKPNPQYDKCDDGTDVVAAHQKFAVQGPDGLMYPTWHAPVVTNPITGKGKCYFGHEHGRNPAEFAYFDEIRRQFAFDANKNGQIESDELAKAGIPFGYVNEQIMSYMAYKGGTTFMRHEDHVGHKVDFANGEGDIGEGTDPFDSSKTGGVAVPVKTASGNPKWQETGVRCYTFDKIHQGVSTPDAFSNNMHEAIMYSKCNSTLRQYPSNTTLLTGMITFGKPGEFLEFCNDGNRTTPVITGLNDDTKNLPGTRDDGFRNIITRACVERTVLVPQGKFSSFPYEDWSGMLRVRNASGKVLASKIGAWEVLDAIRYYSPSAPNGLAYNVDWCYENFNGRTGRGGPCDAMTNYGKIRDITWNDPRSLFRGIHRGQYINPTILDNAGGPSVVYTDPFGGNASTTPFPGSIKQLLAPVKANFDTINTDNRIIQRYHDDGGRTVHAPN